MKRVLLLLTVSLLVSTVTAQQTDDCRFIYYESDEQFNFYDDSFGDAKIINHTFKRGKGVIEFDRAVNTIGYDTFGDRWVYNEDCNLKHITLPESITHIDEYAFSYQDKLKEIIIPNGVSTIGDSAFYGCDLKRVTIPNSVQIIGEGSFACFGILSFKGKFATEDGKALISDNTFIQYANGNKAKTYTIPNNIIKIGNKAFLFSNLQCIIIPDGVTEIGVNAFSNCGNLTDLVIPETVTTIGEYAFGGCSSLESVTIPCSVTTIGRYAFCDCSSLTSVTIPDGVTTIKYGAFIFCRNLASVTIGNSITTIGVHAFQGCDSLTSVYCKAIVPPLLNYDPECYNWDACAAFEGVTDGSLTIYVPRESVEAYKAADGWKEYADIIVGYDF